MMAGKLGSVIRLRLRAWREVVWRPGAWVAGIVYGLLQAYQSFKGEWLSPEDQERWRIANILPPIPWWGWTIGWLVLFVAIILEGAYRSIRERERALHEKDQALLAQATARPKLEVVFEDKCEECFNLESAVVSVGVWNDGPTAEDVRIYLLSLTPGPTFGKLQLPWFGDGFVGIRIHKSMRSAHHHAHFMTGDHVTPYSFAVNSATGTLNTALAKKVEYVARLLVEGYGIAPMVVKAIIDPRQKPPVRAVSGNIVAS